MLNETFDCSLQRVTLYESITLMLSLILVHLEDIVLLPFWPECLCIGRLSVAPLPLNIIRSRG